MTSALIIILREVLEAMLIISLLLAASEQLNIKKRWVIVAVAAGLAGAGLYAYYFDPITDAFEGVGQEITNAISLFSICIFLATFNLFIVSHLSQTARGLPRWTGLIALLGSIGFAITREGAEIYLYVSGYLLSPEPVLPILLGGALGAGIGLSVGALIYYGVKTLKRNRRLLVSSIILVPIGAGMVSQGVRYLMQADLLPAQLPLWDTSMLIPESSVIGELLYALFSYEATPTPLQVFLYVISVLLMLTGMYWMFRSMGHAEETDGRYA